MTGFLATPAAPHSPPDAMLDCGDWWPAIDVNAVRAAMRLKGEVPHERLMTTLRDAAIGVIDDLRGWQVGRVVEGYASLTAITAPEIGGMHRLESLFVRAVRFAAAAELAELSRDASATNDGQLRAEPDEPIAAECRRQSVLAIRALIGAAGATGVDVELI